MGNQGKREVIDLPGRCVIVGGAPMRGYGLLHRTLNQNDYLIAADAGFAHMRKARISPHLAVGDFDSYRGDTGEVECIRLPAEKDDTDMLFAAREGLRRGFREFLLFGAAGGRADHMMANYCVLRFLCGSGADGIMMEETMEVRMLMRGKYTFFGKKGDIVSVFPFDGESTGVTLCGMKYPLYNAKLTSSFPVGVSNVIADQTAWIAVETGALLIFRTRDDSADIKY